MIPPSPYHLTGRGYIFYHLLPGNTWKYLEYDISNVQIKGRVPPDAGTMTSHGRVALEPTAQTHGARPSGSEHGGFKHHVFNGTCDLIGTYCRK